LFLAATIYTMQTLKQLHNGELRGITSLKLSEGLTHFPNEIFELADTLEMLDLSRNQLSSLPADLGRLTKLKIIFCSDNLFTVLPEVLADCPLLDIVGFKANSIETVPAKSLNPNIRWLILTDNKIGQIPAEIGNCHRMQKLMLAGNRLTNLPVELSNCKNLGLLRISANRLTFAGNPFTEKPVVQPLDTINWDELEIHNLLGEGASGVISKASWTTGDVNKQVAVKVFKGAVTSDGLPEDEMDTCITAGSHPGLVQLIGQIAGHPKGNKGLVMELIPQRFYNLGLPPSFESCTRDVFKKDAVLNPQQVIKIAHTIASVAAQLHSKGIMHSDMYAHNTLIDDDGNTLFGDFGAACFYNKAGAVLAHALQRLEVSAYGCLLDDLLSLCPESKTNALLMKISILKDACMAADVSSRPAFQYIEQELSKL